VNNTVAANYEHPSPAMRPFPDHGEVFAAIEAMMKKILIPVCLAAAMLLSGPLVGLAKAKETTTTTITATIVCKKLVLFQIMDRQLDAKDEAAAKLTLTGAVSQGECMAIAPGKTLVFADKYKDMGCYRFRGDKGVCWWAKDISFTGE
jgi:hypothetical protein